MNKQLVFNSIIYGFKSILGILFPLITFPYASNVLGATGIGRVEFANSISNYFIYFAALGISTYAVREGGKVRDDFEKLSKLSQEMLIINTCSAGLAYLGIIGICQIPMISSYSLLIFINSMTIFFAAVGMEWVFTVKEEFTYITIRYIAVELFAVAFLFMFVKTPEDYVLYAIYVVIASGGANIVNLFCLPKYINIFKRRKLELRRHIKPLLLLFSISIVSVIFQNIDVTILGIMGTEGDVGVFQAGMRIHNVAITVLASVSTVVFSHGAGMLNGGDISSNSDFHRLVGNFGGTMMLVSVPLAFGLFTISGNVVDVLLSDEYQLSGVVLAIVSFNIVWNALGRIYGNQILVALGHDAKFFFATMISVLIDVVLDIVLIPSFGAVGPAVSTAVSCGVTAVLSIFWASKIMSIARYMRSSIKFFLASACFPVIGFLSERLVPYGASSLVVTIAACAVFYVGILAATKDRYFVSLVGLVPKRRKPHA